VRYTDDLNEKEKPGNSRSIVSGMGWGFWGSRGEAVNGNEGRLMLRIEEKASLEMWVEDTRDEEYQLAHVQDPDLTFGVNPMWSLVREVTATITIQGERTSDNGSEVRVYGVHWPRIGVLIMTTTSEKFAGIFGLPHLTRLWDYFTTSQTLLLATVGNTPQGTKAASFHASNLSTASPGGKVTETRPVPHCEYVVYIQLHPLQSAFLYGWPYTGRAKIGSEIEKELGCLDGPSILEAPELQMSVVIFSPDCGFVLESKGPSQFSPTDRQRLVCKE
jgi:hypothetical protein